MSKGRWLRWSLLGAAALSGLRLGAQPQAGAWLGDALGAYRYAAIQEPAQRLHEYGFAAEFLFFPHGRLAVGGRLVNSYVAFNGEFFQSHDIDFSIEPQLRYYVRKAPLPLFIQGAGYWRRSELSQFGITGPRSERGGFSAGLGANLYFAQRGCLEGLLEYRYRKPSADVSPEEGVAWSSLALGLRLRAYLSDDSDWPPAAGPGLGAVRGGNWMAGGRLGGALLFGESGVWDVHALGSVFLVNRLALGLSVEMQGFPDAARTGERDFSRSLEPFLRYYFELSDNTLLFPALGYMLGRSDSTTRLGFASTSFNSWRLGVGLDNFLSPALAMEFIFSLSGRTASPAQVPSPRDFDLSFGLSAGLVAYWR